MTRIIRTLILEDDYLDINGIAAIVNSLRDMQVVAKCRTVPEAIAQAETLRPDFIIVDGQIGGDKHAGTKFVRHVRKLLPGAVILGLTQWVDLISNLKRAGCNNAVSKAILDNSEAATQYIGQLAISINNPVRPEPMDIPTLTTQEDKVLRMIVLGYTEEKIRLALRLDTRKQVRTIKDSLKEKFGAIKDAELVANAYITGYLSPGDDLEYDLEAP